ncbi:unnamed protein product [Paramecium primaurelia]|uniref:DUF4378 domain-containing protein n=1 Tax=Paramecium primaurelia TaxID=5886 RepID=A0A8S1LPE9_PARPR|nr:unnamed protein product [Paramecium primaurelia]
MNTQNSFDTQFYESNLQEPNSSISNKKQRNSSRIKSPEQQLEQNDKLKSQSLQFQNTNKKRSSKKKQGKVVSLINTTKKSFYPTQNKNPKQSVQSITTTNRKHNHKKNDINLSETLFKKQNSKIENIQDNIIKLQIKQQNLQKDQNQQNPLKYENFKEFKNQTNQKSNDLYLTLKKTQNSICAKNYEIQILEEQKKKIENQFKLEQLKQKIQLKNKMIDQKSKSPKKTKKKMIKQKQKSKQKGNPNDINSLANQSKQEFFQQSSLKSGDLQNDSNKKRSSSSSARQNQKKQIKNNQQLNNNSEQALDNEINIIFKKYPPTIYLQKMIKKLILLFQDSQSISATLSDFNFKILIYQGMQKAVIKIQKAWKQYCLRKKQRNHKINQLEIKRLIQKHYKSLFNEQIQNKSHSSQINKVLKQKEKISNQIVSNNQYINQEHQIQNIVKNKNQPNSQIIEEQKVINKIPLVVENQTDFQLCQSNQLSYSQSIQNPSNLDQAQMVDEIQNQLNGWNFHLDTYDNDQKKTLAMGKLKKQMKHAIISIIQSQLSKFKLNSNQSDHSFDIKLLQSQEASTEKNFNEARKKVKALQDQSEVRLIQSSKDQITEISKSSLLVLQSQLMKKESELLSMREEAIQLRYLTEIEKIENDENKKIELNKWLKKELEDLQITRQYIELSKKKEASAMKKIQRDLMIASSFDENNSKLISLKQKVEERLSNLKKSKQSQSEVKILNNIYLQSENELEKLEETQSEDFDQENQIEQRQFLKDDIIQPNEEMNIKDKLDLIANDLISDILDNLSEELLNKYTQFALLIQQLTPTITQIPTSIIEIRYYLHNLFDYILPHYGEEIVQKINIPYGYSPQKRLELFYGNYSQQTIDQNYVNFVMLDQYFFEYEFHRLQENDFQNLNHVSKALKELEHIHNRAIFDACNEVLNTFRPYYYNNGEPYPWEARIPHQTIKCDDFCEILNQMESKILQLANCLCGFLPIEEEYYVPREKQIILEAKSQEMMIQHMNIQQNPDLYDTDLQYYFDPIIQIREQRVNKMLIADMQDNEYRWNLASDDKLELLMEIGDMVFEQCIEEFIQDAILL